MSKHKSKNTCFKNDCSAKHHITIHKYSTSNQRDRRSKKWRSQTKFKHEKGRGQKSVIYKPSKEVLMQILPAKVKTSDGKTTTTYALLDNGSQSTLK